MDQTSDSFKEACEKKFRVGAVAFLTKRRLDEWNKLDKPTTIEEAEVRDASPLIIEAVYGLERGETSFPSITLARGPSFILDEDDLENIEVTD
jgi:hypothetical protein